MLFAPVPTAKAGSAEGVAYLLGRQMPDGGFAEPGRSTRGSDVTTAWVVIALCASGKNPHQVRSGGLSPLDFMAARSAGWKSVTDVERTILAAAAAGEDLRSFGGVDLVARLQSYRRPGGNIGDGVNTNAFGILAYRAAGLSVPAGAVEWQKNVQNADGGWGNNPGGASNPDMTAASIMALRAAGVGPTDPSIRAALDYLHRIQNADGGFSFQPGISDVSATSWCIQAITAAGEDPAGPAWSKGGNTPVSFVLSMQQPDGRFLWMPGVDRNPVWTTAYAVCALSRRPYPVLTSFRSPGRTAPEAGVEAGEESAGDVGPGGESRAEDPHAAEEESGMQTENVEEASPGGMEAGEGVKKASSAHGKEVSSPGPAGEEGGSPGSFPWWIPVAVSAALAAAALGWWLYRRPAS
jgi:hypothetical protein